MTPTQFVDEFAEELPIGPYDFLRVDDAGCFDLCETSPAGHPMIAMRTYSADQVARLLLGAIVEESSYFDSRVAQIHPTGFRSGYACADSNSVSNDDGPTVRDPADALFARLSAACAARRKARGA